MRQAGLCLQLAVQPAFSLSLVLIFMQPLVAKNSLFSRYLFRYRASAFESAGKLLAPELSR
jgi:hypothetical protein